MSNDTYLVPDLKKGEIHRTELTIKKSRFITSIARTHGVDEAKAFIDKVTNEFMDARHNCFAFNADKPGTSGYAGCSDDGEPHGTAGQPMLNVILHSFRNRRLGKSLSRQCQAGFGVIKDDTNGFNDYLQSSNRAFKCHFIPTFAN